MKQITVDRRLFNTIGNHDDLEIPKQRHDSDLALVEVIYEVQKDNTDVKIHAEKILKGVKGTPGWESVRGFCNESHILILCSAKLEALDSETIQHASNLMLSSDFGGVNDHVIKTRKLRIWRPYYQFGPAPRHLNQQGDDIWIHNGTRTTPKNLSSTGIASVEGYATLQDGTKLPYRLEGSSDPSAKVICLVNSVMVHWNIWDDFITHFFALGDNKNKYQILRYAPRGRFPPPPGIASRSATIDLLASDIMELLDALKVDQAECIMGVSLGGATALGAALQHPKRVKTFVACDTNAASPAGNSKLWLDRIAIAEKEGAAIVTSEGMQSIIGENLADVTVKRWAAPSSLTNPELMRKLQQVKNGVKVNSLEGFKLQVQALYDYDFWEDMKSAETEKPRGMFIVGAQDGKLPEGMKKMAEGYGPSDATLHVVEEAGHLPMVEKPKEVAEMLCNFLSST